MIGNLNFILMYHEVESVTDTVMINWVVKYLFEAEEKIFVLFRGT